MELSVMELSVIVPTYNEAENIEPLVRALEASLNGTDFEIIICDDDSPDLTWRRVEDLARHNPRVRVLRRFANRGLGHAVVDGFKSAQGQVVACIDADLQHDPAILPSMLSQLKAGCDLVIGSRYVHGGGTSNWNAIRRFESWMATKLTQKVLNINLGDPMSGYFMLRRESFLGVAARLNPAGFKILLEIAAHLKPSRVAEVPYTFQGRQRGQSKLSQMVVFDFLRQLCRLWSSGRVVPAEFTKFAFVGSTGVLINLGLMALLLKLTAVQGWQASTLSTLGATVSNYVLNNFWTFRDRAHSGVTLIARYWYYLLVSFGGLVVTTATFTASSALIRKMLGGVSENRLHVVLLCQLLGILAGTISNYIMNRSFTWPKPSCLPEQKLENLVSEYSRKTA